jgi:hypothetical protein
MPAPDSSTALLDQLDVVVVPAEHPKMELTGVTLPEPITITIPITVSVTRPI